MIFIVTCYDIQSKRLSARLCSRILVCKNCGSVTTMTIMTIVRNRPMDTDLWTVAEAKAKLSQVIDEAQKRGPQTITKNGRRTVVVVDAAEWERRTRPPGTLSDFFAASPLRGSRLKVRRSRDRLRSTDL